jgi:hypothetical protein
MVVELVLRSEGDGTPLNITYEDRKHFRLGILSFLSVFSFSLPLSNILGKNCKRWHCFWKLNRDVDPVLDISRRLPGTQRLCRISDYKSNSIRA